MKTKSVKIPISITLVAPSRWEALYDGKRVDFREFYDEDEVLGQPIEVMIQNTIAGFRSFAELCGVDAQVEAQGKSMSFTAPGIGGLKCMVSELLTQLEVHDQLGPGVYQEMLQLLYRPPPPKPFLASIMTKAEQPNV